MSRNYRRGYRAAAQKSEIIGTKGLLQKQSESLIDIKPPQYYTACETAAGRQTAESKSRLRQETSKQEPE